MVVRFVGSCCWWAVVCCPAFVVGRVEHRSGFGLAEGDAGSGVWLMFGVS